jgi:hypothetical protein
MGIVRINNEGLIVVAGRDGYLRAYRYPDGILKWTSFKTILYGSNISMEAPAVGFADFDNDGTPEVYAGSKIFNAVNGQWLCEGTAEYKGFSIQDSQTQGGSLSVAVDVNGDGKLELITGNCAWSVENNNGTWKMSKYKIADLDQLPKIDGVITVKKDGHVSVADLNSDGHPDAVISLVQYDAGSDKYYSILYGWDIFNNRILFHEYRPGNKESEIGANKSIPFIGNIDADKSLEIICLFDKDLRAYNLPPVFAPASTLSLAWSRQADERWGRTGITLFDFNQDGKAELVYRDQSKLRIIDGTTDGTTNLAIFDCYSATTWEYPVVADVDGDGAAEIIVASAAGSDRTKGNMYIYKSENMTQPWAPARKVWNQYAYNAVNINEDLTVPANQFNPATVFPGTDKQSGTDDDVRPFNNFLQQQTSLSKYGLPMWLAMEVEFDENEIEEYYDATGDSLVIKIKIKNVGYAPISAPFYVTAYKNSIEFDNVIAVDSTSQPVDPGAETVISVIIRNVSTQDIETIKIRLNDRRTNTQLQPECDYNANISIERKVDDILWARNDYVTIIEQTTVTVDIQANDSISDDCNTPVFRIIKQPSHGVATLNPANEMVYNFTDNSFFGIDTATYEIACNNDTTVADVHILRPHLLSAEYIACENALVTIRFEEIDNIMFDWYEEDMYGNPVKIESESFILEREKNSMPEQIFWAEPYYGSDDSKIVFPRYPVTVRHSDNCGLTTPTRGCAIDGTVIWREDFGGNSDNDPQYSTIPLPENITEHYFVSGVPVDDERYTLTKHFAGTSSLLPFDDHTIAGPDNGYFMLVNGAENAGKLLYTTTMTDLCGELPLYFSAWAGNPAIGTTAQLRFTVQDASTNETLVEYVSKVSSGGNWKFYGFRFINHVSSLKLSIYDDSGSDFVIDDIELRLCAPKVTTDKTDETIICYGDGLQITGTYHIDCTFDDDSLSYKWEFRHIESDVWVTLKHDTVTFANCGTVIAPFTTTWLIPQVDASNEGYYRLLVGSPSSIGNANCRASSDSIHVSIQKIPIVPDIRISVCPAPDRLIYLTSFLDSLNCIGIEWEKANNASPTIEDIEAGKISASNMKSNATYKYRYSLIAQCGTRSAIAYVHVLGNRLPRKIDTVVICKSQELSKYVQLNQILGLELNGTWNYNTPINPDNTVSDNVKVFSASSKYYGARVFNACQAWKTATHSDYTINYKGDTEAKKNMFEYTPPSGSCITQPQKLVIIITSKLAGN